MRNPLLAPEVRELLQEGRTVDLVTVLQEMHPSDAAARHLDDGAPVRIFNSLGEVRCNLQIGSWIRPGTVSLPKGLWRRHTSNGYTANALVPDTLTDLGGGACFNDARVQVEAIIN